MMWNSSAWFRSLLQTYLAGKARIMVRDIWQWLQYWYSGHIGHVIYSWMTWTPYWLSGGLPHSTGFKTECIALEYQLLSCNHFTLLLSHFHLIKCSKHREEELGSGGSNPHRRLFMGLFCSLLPSQVAVSYFCTILASTSAPYTIRRLVMIPSYSSSVKSSLHLVHMISFDSRFKI